MNLLGILQCFCKTMRSQLKHTFHAPKKLLPLEIPQAFVLYCYLRFNKTPVNPVHRLMNIFIQGRKRFVTRFHQPPQVPLAHFADPNYKLMRHVIHKFPQ